jgi:Uma2 family endonuclease
MDPAYAAMIRKAQPLTAEQFDLLPLEGPCELVNGEVLHLSPTRRRHGKVVSRLGRYLDEFVEAGGLGEVYGAETGFIVRRDPDTVRGADAAFVAAERLAGVGDDVFLPFAPDLAVEVVSPSERPAEILDKVRDYLAAGSRLVWVVNPRRRHVQVFREDGTLAVVEPPARLTGDPVLPGFSVSLDALFG